MKPLRILSHGPSDSLNSLLDSLRTKGLDNIKKIKTVNSSYRGIPGHVVFNWGCCSRRAISPQFPIINKPEAVYVARDKTYTFQYLAEAGLSGNLPDWTTSKQVAREYLQCGTPVYCRTSTTGSQGSGIIIATNVDELVDAPLYTAIVPTQREVRLHIFNGELIYFAQKRRMSSERREESGVTLSHEIRNLENGWVFARDGVSIPDNAIQVAKDAVAAIGLDFGAVDMALSLSLPKIFEINTAPGMEGSTLEAYSNQLESIVL